MTVVAATGSGLADYALRPAEYAVAPVEYAVAVDRFLTEGPLRPSSRRIYRISLAGWAWPLVGQLPPAGAGRRKASPPVVPLTMLEHDQAGRRLARALEHRLRQAEVRTVSRELSALRSAISWWQRRQWISADPTAGLSMMTDRPAAARPLTETELARLYRRPASLRDQAFWHLLRDSRATAEAVLALDAGAIDLRGRRARSAGSGLIEWGSQAGELLGWLLAGRRCGPVFLTDRRAPAGSPAADTCPLSGRGRMSYRRAAEIFAAHTRPLDPDGRGWMLHQLRRR